MAGKMSPASDWVSGYKYCVLGAASSREVFLCPGGQGWGHALG